MVWNVGELNKGKHLSKELRKKISETTSKAMLNPDIRKRLSKSHKGRHLSPKTEFKKGLVSWNKGKIGIYSEESLKKMSTSAKLTQNEGRYKKGHTFSEETINKQRLAKIGKKTSEETKKKLKSIWNKPEYIKLAKERRAKLIFPVKDSLPEIKIQNFLRQLGIPFLKHKHIKEIEHSYQCDIFIPSMNLIIECDGNYWHKYPVGREIDNLRTNELIDKGFKVLRLWESDIKKMNFKDFIERIKPFEKV